MFFLLFKTDTSTPAAAVEDSQLRARVPGLKTTTPAMRSVIFVLVVAAIAALVSSAAAGSLQDVEHVVIFMQENRAFDHCA